MRVIGVLLCLFSMCLGMRDVIFIQDAGVDDYMSTVLLAAEAKKGNIRLVLEVITDADSLLPWSVYVGTRLRKMIDLGAKYDYPMLSKAKAINPFPYEYRADCYKMFQFKSMNGSTLTSLPPADEIFAETLRAAPPGTITVVSTAPITPLTLVLQQYPELINRIETLIWMGGAVFVPGNLGFKDLPFNNKAEWNVYWDPYATQWLFNNTQFPIYLFPLDISNNANITPEFLAMLLARANTSVVAQLAYDSYKMCADSPFGAGYKLWDTIATSYVGHPELFELPKKVKLECITDYPNQGWTKPVDVGGREVLVFTDFAKGGMQGLYEYVADPEGFKFTKP